jgi:tryptophan 7-halogenase
VKDNSEVVARPVYQILGGGFAGWSVAAALASALQGVADIFIVPGDAGAETALGVDAAVIYPDSALLKHDLANEADMVTEAKAGFWLGTQFSAWGPGGRDVFHAPSEALPVRDGIAVHQILRRLSLAENNPAMFGELYQQLLFQARMAAAGKFAPAAEDRASPRSLLNPAITADANGVALIMQRKALGLNVAILAAPLAVEETRLTLDCRSDDGDLAAQDWIDASPCFGADRIMTARAAPIEAHNHPPYDSVIALEHGMLHLLHLRGASIASLYFDSAAMDDEASAAALAAALPGYQLTRQRSGNWRAGRMARPWSGQIVRMGSGAARLGSIMGLDAKLLSAQIERLLTLLPDGGGADLPSKSEAYNAAVAATFDHLRDFIHTPMVRNGLSGARWEQLRQAPLSDALARRLNQFERRGHYVMLDYDVFESNIWIALFIGLGITPDRYDRVADSVNMPKKMKELGQMVMAFDATIQAMPSHDMFLQDMIKRIAL